MLPNHLNFYEGWGFGENQRTGRGLLLQETRCINKARSGCVGVMPCNTVREPGLSPFIRLRGVFRRGFGEMAAIFRRKSSHLFGSSQGPQIGTLLFSAVIPVDTAVGMEVYPLAAAGITRQKEWIYPPDTAGYSWSVPPYTRMAVLFLYSPTCDAKRIFEGRVRGVSIPDPGGPCHRRIIH